MGTVFLKVKTYILLQNQKKNSEIYFSIISSELLVWIEKN
jgi:hypothetical protein